jgi:hypothetical protein
MVFTIAQTTLFFEAQDQMGIPADTRLQLANEGIQAVSDLSDFYKDTLTQVADNLRRPGGRIANPDPNAPLGATIAQPPFVFGAKAQQRLLAACDMVRYYEMIDRELSASNMRWEPVIKNFTQQWKALKDRKDGEAPEVPKISKTLSIIKWTEAFTDFLHRKIGVRMVPLAYVVREVVVPLQPPPPLATNLPYSDQHGSVEGELTARASHGHPLYRDDNSAVYYLLEEATRGTSYAPTIKPYQRTKNGREAWRSLVNQYAGEDKWQSELKRQDELLHNRQWKGQSNFSLEKFIAQHRNAFVSMRQCAEHVTFQLPNERTRVSYLLDAIQCNDPGLQAAMAQVRTDSDANGRMNDFEATASYLLPYDPVSKKRAAGAKRGLSSISDLTGEDNADISSVSQAGRNKPSIGKSGVEFRYYKSPEYNLLSTPQKAELKEFRDNKKANSGRQGPAKKSRNGTSDENKHKKWIASAVEKQLAKTQNNQDDDNTEADFKSYIMSLMSEAKQPAPAAATTASVTTQMKKVTLNSILRKVKPKQS